MQNYSGCSNALSYRQLGRPGGVSQTGHYFLRLQQNDTGSERNGSTMPKQGGFDEHFELKVGNKEVYVDFWEKVIPAITLLLISPPGRYYVWGLFNKRRRSGER